LRLHRRLPKVILNDGVAFVLVHVHVSGEHEDWRSRLRNATARSQRSMLQGVQRCLHDPFSCRSFLIRLGRRADVQASGYEEPVLVRMLRSSNDENHDNELRLNRFGKLDDLWLAHQRQGDAGAVSWLLFRLPRCHVCLAGDGLIMRGEVLGDEPLGVFWDELLALVLLFFVDHNFAEGQPFFVAPNFAEGEHVKILLRDAFGYHAA